MARRNSTLFALLAAFAITGWACAGASDPSSRVTKALEHERIQGVSTHWEDEHDVVVLKGQVPSDEVRAQAGKIAQQAAGRSAMVVNELDVPGAAEHASVGPETHDQ
jgi:hypothetical protein